MDLSAGGQALLSGRFGLGGGSSPVVPTARQAPLNIADVAYGTGSTSPSSGAAGIVGSSPGHFAFYAGLFGAVALILIRHSLPR